MKQLNQPFQNFKPFRNQLNRYRDLNMTHNEHVYAICCRLEVDDDAISGRYVKTAEGYIVVNFEVASSRSFRDIQKNHLVMVEANIDDSIKRKRIGLKSDTRQNYPNATRTAYVEYL